MRRQWLMIALRLILIALALVSLHAHADVQFRAAAQAFAPGGTGTFTTNITYVGSGSRSSTQNGKQVTPTLPAHVAGDLLICTVTSRKPQALSISDPQDWTEIYSLSQGELRAAAYYRIATSSGTPAPTITKSGNDNTSMVARCSAYRGVDPDNPLDVSYAAYAGPSGNIIRSGSLTPQTVGVMLLFAAHMDAQTNPETFPGWNTAFTETPSGTNIFLGLYHRPWGDTPTGTFMLNTSNSGRSYGVLIALRPQTPTTYDLPTLTVPTPAGTLPNDVMIAAIAVMADSPTIVANLSITAPAGWTQIREVYQNNQDGDNERRHSRLITYYRVAGPSEPAGYTWEFSDPHDGVVGGIVSFSGVDTTNPIGPHDGQPTPRSQDHLALGLNLSVPNVMMVTAFEFANSRTWQPYTGWINNPQEAVDVASHGNSANGISMAIYYELQPKAGFTGTRTARASSNSNADQGATQSIALMPIPEFTPGQPGPVQTELGHCVPLSGGGVVNTYYPGTASVAQGATSIPVGTPTGAAEPIAPGDMLLVIQMQDTDISAQTADNQSSRTNSNYGQTADLRNAGRYEYVIAASAIVNGVVHLETPITTPGGFTHADATSTTGQRRFQVIRVPTFSSGMLVNGLTAQPWNGSTGGVLAVDVYGTLDLNDAYATVNGLGFRGGGSRKLGGSSNTSYNDYWNLSTRNAHGGKAEGAAGTPRFVYTHDGQRLDLGTEGYPGGSTARGAPANAGGGGSDGNPQNNNHNTGGGGGGNAGAGGRGGNSYSSNRDTGGIGGRALSPNAARLFMGGGGGGGTNDNGSTFINGAQGSDDGQASSGAPGGGIIMIRAGAVSGSGYLLARGMDGNSTPRIDGSGGGGAGGSLLVYAASGGLAGLTIDVRGGSGGSNQDNSPHGPGGGGGGGYAASSGLAALYRVDGGAPGTTAYGSTNYGAQAGSAGHWMSALTLQDIPGATPRSCVVLQGFEIVTGGANASTCAPKHITIRAIDGNGNVVTDYTGTVLISTSTNRGDWSVVSAQGTFDNGAANDGKATYTFVAGDNGEIVLALSNAHADDLTVSVEDSVIGNASLSTSSTIQFRDNAFVITVTDPLGDVPVAGRPHTLQVAIVRRDPSNNNQCGTLPYSGNLSLKAWLTAGGSHPGGAVAPTLDVSSPEPLPFAQPANTNVTLSFTNGVANFELWTADVGQYALNLLDGSRQLASGMDIAGNSPQFTVRPFAFHVQVPGNPSPPSTGPNDPLFTAAGEDFQAVVRAVLWQAGDDADNDGHPDANANLADNGTTPAYAWNTVLSADTAPGTFWPVAGRAGTVGNGVVPANAFIGGSATPTTLRYSEVGSFTLRAAAQNYLGAAGADIGDAGGVIVGRFRPYEFGVTLNTPAFETYCGSGVAGFTYVGQNFRYATAPEMTVRALNKQGDVTENYTVGGLNGGWFKLTATNRTYSVLTGTLDLGLVPANDPVITIESAGTAKLVFDDGGGIQFTRTAPVAPFDAEISLAVTLTDSDGTAYADNPARFGTPTHGGGIDFTHGKEMRFGRLRIFNALGSVSAPLFVPMQTEYWNGSAFVPNTADDCTTLEPSDIAMDNYEVFAPNSCPTAIVGGPVAFSGGKAQMTFSAPVNGSNGSIDLRANLGTPSGQYCPAPNGVRTDATSAVRGYLKGRWNDAENGAGYDDDPVARITFGVYGPQAPKRFIYSRENY